MLVTGVFFFIYFAVLDLVYELKQNLEAQPYPEMNLNHQIRVELLWSSMGKIISSLYPILAVDWEKQTNKLANCYWSLTVFF